jgi:hypothetical protein
MKDGKNAGKFIEKTREMNFLTPLSFKMAYL